MDKQKQQGGYPGMNQSVRNLENVRRNWTWASREKGATTGAAVFPITVVLVVNKKEEDLYQRPQPQCQHHTSTAKELLHYYPRSEPKLVISKLLSSENGNKVHRTWWIYIAESSFLRIYPTTGTL